MVEARLLRVPTAKRLRIERKLVDRARPHLAGEEVLRVFRGQTFVSPVLMPLIGPLLVKVKLRTVMVTEKSVVTVQQSSWSQSTVVALVSRYDCGSVRVAASRWALRIGADEPIFASLTTLGDMSAVARLAARTLAWPDWDG